VSFAGNDYWAGCSAVLVDKDRPRVRFNRNYLVEIVEDNSPGPNILLSGDVERNPGPPRFSQSHGVSEYTLEDIVNMKAWQADKVSDRIRDATSAREEPNAIYTLVLHPGEDEPEEFQTIDQHQEPVYMMDAMTDLVVLAEIADPSFLLMINRVEAILDDPQEVRRLQEYGPLAMHLVNCLMSVMDIS
jgi:hypothetical protein